MAEQRLNCGEVWGGFAEEDLDLCSGGLTISLFSSSARGREGGDVYYLSVCGQDQLTRIALADVVGHGADVRDVSQWLYQAVESRVDDARGAHLLGELNGLAVERGIESMATVALASFERSQQGATFAYAGHAPALVRRRGQTAWHPAELDPANVTHPNAPLGVVPGAGFDEWFEPLGPGDRMLLYTDGLVEARADDGEPFGEKRLHELLEAEGDAPLHDLKGALLESLARHSPDAHRQDDVSLVAVEVAPR
ncbi:MAG: PP2C family protein-serine/threonine phosphatase [Myxococcota bacterium]